MSHLEVNWLIWLRRLKTLRPGSRFNFSVRTVAVLPWPRRARPWQSSVASRAQDLRWNNALLNVYGKRKAAPCNFYETIEFMLFWYFPELSLLHVKTHPEKDMNSYILYTPIGVGIWLYSVFIIPMVMAGEIGACPGNHTASIELPGQSAWNRLWKRTLGEKPFSWWEWRSIVQWFSPASSSSKIGRNWNRVNRISSYIRWFDVFYIQVQ